MAEIKSWCMYCKDPIYETEESVTCEGNEYHKDCFVQMNTFYDELDIGDNE